MWLKWLLYIVAVMPISVLSQIRHYSAAFDNSQWQLVERPKIECHLAHDIPSYGRAIFSSYANKKLNMQFTLDMWQKPDSETYVKLMSLSPSWKANSSKYNDNWLSFNLKQYFDGELSKVKAWQVLNELNKGKQPTFFYKDWYDKVDNIAVTISVVNFSTNFTKFKKCIAELLPYSFDDIAFTVLGYKQGGSELTHYSKKQLAKINEYLTYDPKAELVLVNAYTDSFGGKNVNQKIANKRAQSVKAFFVNKGISVSKIKTNAHGERRHIDSNDHANGRRNNRRVVIQLN